MVRCLYFPTPALTYGCFLIDGETPPKPVSRSKGKGREREVKGKPTWQGKLLLRLNAWGSVYPFHLETIITSGSEGNAFSQTDNGGSETERESPPPHAAKRQRGMYPARPSIVLTRIIVLSLWSRSCRQEQRQGLSGQCVISVP